MPHASSPSSHCTQFKHAACLHLQFGFLLLPRVPAPPCSWPPSTRLPRGCTRSTQSSRAALAQSPCAPSKASVSAAVCCLAAVCVCVPTSFCCQRRCQRSLNVASAAPPAHYPPCLPDRPPACLPAHLPALQMWTGLLPTIWMSSLTKLSTTATSPGPGTSPGRPATRWVASCSARCCCRCCPVVCLGLCCGSAVVLLVLELVLHAGWPPRCRTQQGGRRLNDAGGWAEGRAGRRLILSPTRFL